MFFIGKMKACILIIDEKHVFVSMTVTGEKLLTFNTALLLCQ